MCLSTHSLRGNNIIAWPSLLTKLLGTKATGARLEIAPVPKLG